MMYTQKTDDLNFQLINNEQIYIRKVDARARSIYNIYMHDCMHRPIPAQIFILYIFREDLSIRQLACINTFN